MSRSARSVSLAVLVALCAAPAAVADPAGDGPGALSHFDLARKDCVGTARNTTSKVCFTVANGVLSDVYFPTNDNTNVETLQYVVTDGSTFTDLQTRDTTYSVEATDDRALTCRVTTTAKSGRYRIVTDFVTDPSRPTVLIRSRFVALQGKISDYRLYVRHDPTLNGNGGGGTGNGGADTGGTAQAGGHTLLVGSDTVTATNAANRDYAVPVHSALDVTGGLQQATNGFAKQPSDGLVQLDASHALTATHESAAQGNLVQVGRVPLGGDGNFTLALGYGTSQSGAIATAQRSLSDGFDGVERDYQRGWHSYDAGLVSPRRPGGVSASHWGDSSDGRPWENGDPSTNHQGNGHLWPVLAGERGQYEIDRGAGPAIGRLDAMRNMSSGVGLITEQAWELGDLAASPFGTAPEIASIGFQNGKPAGSASALTWSAGQFVRLTLDAAAGRVLDRPAYTFDRYVRRTQGATTLSVTAPADQSAVGDSVTVTGTTAAGNNVTVAATNTDTSFGTVLRSTTVGSSGAFSLTIPLTGGTWVLNVVATSPSGATARAVRTVVFDQPPGTLIFGVDDPDGDDNGPGNYAYPTAGDFHAGAYDLERFEVYDADPNVVFRVRTRDLTPTFGSPLGAQLVDVYVHVPGASPTSTAASFPQRNYTIASPGGDWSRLLEVQGFGQRFVDASGATLGTITIKAKAISRYITFSVPKSALGTPTSGWAFTVVLTGQDGFSPDQARGFQTTPQDFQFGVCATASSDPHCTVDPTTVPKAMDVLTPSGVSQSDELDYTVHPTVTIAPVVIP